MSSVRNPNNNDTTPTVGAERGSSTGSQSGSTWTWVDEYQKYLDEHKDNGVNDPTINVLQGLNGNSNMTMLGMLSLFMMGMEDGGKWTTERIDMFLQFLLQYMTSRDQRQYDKEQLIDQRLYNNPTNELARLMAAGISRDKAIELLSSGGSGGSGAGSLIGSGAGASAPSVSAPSGSVELQQTNTIIGAIKTVFDMVAQGFGIQQSVETSKTLHNQNNLTQLQLKAIDSANQIGQVIENLQRDGVLSEKDISAWTNVSEMESWFRDHLDTKYIAPLVQTGAFNDAFGTIQGREMLNKLHEQRLRSQSDGDVYKNYVRQERAKTAVLNLQPALISAELANIDAQTFATNATAYKAIQEICFIQHQDERAQEMQPYLIQESISRTDVNKQTAANLYEDTNNKMWQGELLEMQFELNSSGFPMLKQNYLDELEIEMDYWATLTDPKVRAEQIDLWKQDISNKRSYNYLQTLYYTAAGNFFARNPRLLEICSGMKEMHVFDTLDGWSRQFQAVSHVWNENAGTGLKSLDLFF